MHICFTNKWNIGFRTGYTKIFTLHIHPSISVMSWSPGHSRDSQTSLSSAPPPAPSGDTKAFPVQPRDDLCSPSWVCPVALPCLNNSREAPSGAHRQRQNRYSKTALMCNVMILRLQKGNILLPSRCLSWSYWDLEPIQVNKGDTHNHTLWATWGDQLDQLHVFVLKEESGRTREECREE